MSTIGSGCNSVQMKKRLAILKTLVADQIAGSSLRSRAVHSGAWIGGGFALQKALQFGSNLILTRLLFPEAFGLMALATVFLVGLAMFSDVGIKPAIIRHTQEDDLAFLNTAWTFQVIRGVALTVAGASLAYPISIIYNEPVMFPLLAFLSLTALISGLNSVNLVIAERNLRFNAIIKVQLAGQICSIFLLIGLSYFWRSVWALAVANVISTTLMVLIGYWALPGHRHRFEFDRQAAGSIVGLGKWLFFSTVATYLGGEGLRAMQAGLLTPSEFGVLTIAYTIAAIPTELAGRLSGSIGLAALAETYRRNPDRIPQVAKLFRRRMVYFSVFLSSIVIFLGSPAIEFLYDDRYHAAGSFLALMGISAAVNSVQATYSGIILGIADSRYYLIYCILCAIFRICAVYAGFQAHHIDGMILAIAVANIIIYFSIVPIIRNLNVWDFKFDTLLLVVAIFISYIFLSILY